MISRGLSRLFLTNILFILCAYNSNASINGIVITDNIVVEKTPADAIRSFALYSFANTTTMEPAGSAPEITNNSLLKSEIGSGIVISANKTGSTISRRNTATLMLLH